MSGTAAQEGGGQEGWGMGVGGTNWSSSALGGGTSRLPSVTSHTSGGMASTCAHGRQVDHGAACCQIGHQQGHSFAALGDQRLQSGFYVLQFLLLLLQLAEGIANLCNLPGDLLLLCACLCG